MNRLQKKCVMVTVGIHLLLVVILIVGPAFLSRNKADDLQVLDVIPANLIDANFSSGVKNAQPPPPAPAVVTPPAPAVVTPPAPVPPPKVTLPDLVKEVQKMLAPEPKPVEKPAANPPHKIQVDLKPVVRTVPKNSTPDNSQQRAQAIKSVLRTLKKNLSSSTTIEAPGTGSVAYASYDQAVKSVYEQAWEPPADAANDEANVRVQITIARDGTVISAHILTPSGDSGLDATIQRTLERVVFIAPFPDGATEKERTYIINFNLKAKRMLG